MVKPRSDILIPGYRILRELGRGGMASVYLAEQESIEREVALKVMLPALAASDPSFSMRFVREAKIVARLAHPHITAVYDVGVSGPHHFFSMEYVTGGDLKSRIREGMMPKLSFAIACQIASALAFAHAKKYVHRDVKPENILFRQDGTALLSDFGIAKSGDVATQMTATGIVIGTPHYMSPEQAQGHELDHRSDLYSLGIMLYEMLTGSLPYTGSSALSIGIKHLKEPIPQLTPPAHVYQPLLNKLLAKNPADRFQSGEEVVAAIDAMVTGAQTIVTQPTVVTKPSATQTTTSPAGTTVAIKQRAPLLIATAVGALLLIGGAAFLMRNKTSTPTPALAESTTSTLISPVTIDQTTSNRESINTLLAAADKAAAAGHYLEPRDNSAVDGYRKVLDIDRGNARSTRGLQDIARKFITQAERAIEKKDYDQAEAFLKNAEETDPEHPLLYSRRLALNEIRQRQSARTEGVAKSALPKSSPTPVTTAKIDPPKATIASTEKAHLSAPREHEQLDSIYSRLQELISSDSLSPTRLGLATELLAEATKLSPKDARLKGAPIQIADGYLRLATTKAEEKQYQDAETLIRRGLELKSDHRLLLALQKEVTEKQKPRRQTFGGF